jgi:hypothetical protein
LNVFNIYFYLYSAFLYYITEIGGNMTYN